MRGPTRRELALAVMLALVVAVLLIGFRGSGAVGRATDATVDSSIGGSVTFVIRGGGVSRAISPGKMVALDLTLDNTNDLDLDIDRITVVVVSVDAPQADADHPCSAADFEVRQLAGGVVLRVAGKSSASLSGLDLPQENWPAVGMINRPVNQDGCKGATLTLRYEASGTEVPE